jgi:hypoxanthine phosphoribosyltransferase
MHEDIERIIFSEDAIRTRVAELAAEINRDYEGKNPVVVGILQGAVVFFTDLTRQLTMEMEMDFMSVSIYRSGRRSSGPVGVIKDLEKDIRGRDVLVIEDEITTGTTLTEVQKIMLARGPTSVKFCTLLDKGSAKRSPIQPDYIGFRIPGDGFIVGYGIDFAGKYRSLPYIAELKPEKAKLDER